MRFDLLKRNIVVFIFGIIILLGEGFKILLLDYSINLSAIFILVLFFLFIFSNPKFYFNFLDKLFFIFSFIFFFFFILGLLRGNHINDILEDAYPIFIFILLFFIFRNFNIADSYFVWKRLLIICIFACLKVFLIFLLPYNIDWSNNWQATKEPIPFTNAFRIILRGGDLFLSFSLVTLILFFLFLKKISNLYILYIFLFFSAVFLSLSRSSFLADIISIIIILLLYYQFFIKKKIISLFAYLFLSLILILPFLNIINLVFNIFEKRNAAFDNNNVAVEFRTSEREIIFNQAKSFYYFGNGLGSYFYIDYSGSTKSDGRSIYSHDFNAWFILKMGLFGLLLLYLIMFFSFFNFNTYLKKRKDFLPNHKYIIFCLSLQSAFIVFFIISFFANKVNTTSGAIFLAFYSANSLNITKK